MFSLASSPRLPLYPGHISEVHGENEQVQDILIKTPYLHHRLPETLNPSVSYLILAALIQTFVPRVHLLNPEL